MNNVNFDIYEIGIEIGDRREPNWDHETVTITGYGIDSNVYLPTITALDPSSSISPTISGNSAYGVGHDAHGTDDDGVNIQFGADYLDRIVIQYEMRRRTDIGDNSFGIGLGDISFDSNAIPEPTGALLAGLAGCLVLASRRRRQ